MNEKEKEWVENTMTFLKWIYNNNRTHLKNNIGLLLEQAKLCIYSFPKKKRSE